MSVDRVLGLLLGTAIGDTLGAPFEGKTTVPASALDVVEQGEGRLVHTDDTVLSMALAEYVIACRGKPLDQDALADAFAAAWRAEPWWGYGPGAAEVFRLISGEVTWQTATRAAFGGEGSFGNGAAMRVAPVALAAAGLHDAAELARRSAEVTHAHEHGIHGAEFQACAAYQILHSDPGRPLDVDQLLHDLGRVVRSRQWHAKLERIAELVLSAAAPEHAARALGNDVTALGSVPTALLAFLIHRDDPAETIRYAIRVGGDTDTIAAMAGALAGARHGAAAFPEAWTARLEAADRIRALAARWGVSCG